MDKPIIKFGISQQEFKEVIDFICLAKGIDVGSYRQNFVYRRLWTRLAATQSKNCSNYLGILRTNPSELERLLDALSINVSEFFRNPEVFEAFGKTVLPELLKKKEYLGSRSIRVWSAGCAYGQEAYSLAILIKEALENRRHFIAKIWGTDVDKDALEKAKKAEYGGVLLKDVKKEVLEKYFISGYNGLYKLKDSIKNTVVFQQHNLFTDKPLKYMDIIFCRNTLIYFNRQQQEVLFNKFYHSLKPEGYLVIGQVESVWHQKMFRLIDLRRRIYQKQEIGDSGLVKRR